MRKPSLTFDTFVTALAVFGLGASTACSKAPAASVGPEPPAAAAAPSPTATPPLPGPAGQSATTEGVKTGEAPALTDSNKATEPSATSTTPARAIGTPTVGATAVEGGKPAPSKTDLKKNPKSQMSCGAGGCSPDMKKGGN